MFWCIYVSYCAKMLQSCPAFCNNMDYSPPGSSVHGMLQERILKWSCLLPGGLPDPGIKPMSLIKPCIGR